MARGPRPHAGEATRSKYGAVATVVDGVRFDSAREARRWCELKLLERAGQIRGLARQVEYELTVPGLDGHAVTIGVYIADFVYEESAADRGPGSWRLVVADAKGVRTPLYVWKSKHFAAEYGFKIREV